jgi:hypothetical protein
MKALRGGEGERRATEQTFETVHQIDVADEAKSAGFLEAQAVLVPGQRERRRGRLDRHVRDVPHGLGSGIGGFDCHGQAPPGAGWGTIAAHHSRLGRPARRDGSVLGI